MSAVAEKTATDETGQDETGQQDLIPGAEAPSSVEQAADLARLEQSIADSDPLPGSPGEPELVPSGNYGDDASMCVDMFADMATAYCADVADLWPTSTRRKVSVALEAVFKKYNFSFAKFGPELALVMTAGPVLYQTSKAIALAMSNPAPAPDANN